MAPDDTIEQRALSIAKQFETAEAGLLEGLFWQFAPLLEERLVGNKKSQNIQLPLVVDKVSDEFYGVAYPIPESDSGDIFKDLNTAILRACWKLGGTFRGNDQIKGFRGYYVNTKDPNEILEHLGSREVVKTTGLNPAIYNFQLGNLQSRYSVKELAETFEIPEQELRILLVQDKKLKQLSYKEGRRRYFKPQAMLYLQNRDEKILEKQLKAIDMCEGLPGYIPPLRWDNLRKLTNSRGKKTKTGAFSSQEIVSLFGTWRNFMAEAGFAQPKHVEPKDLSKEAFVKAGERFVAVYEQPPLLKTWLEDPESPHPRHLKKYWSTFNDFLTELGYAPKPVEPEKKPVLSKEQSDNIRLLALRNHSKQRISKELGIEVKEVTGKLNEFGVLTRAWVKKKLKTIDDVVRNEIPRAQVYPKQAERDWMEESVLEEFESEKIRYLGLEGSHFGSYVSIAQLADIDSKESLLAEWDAQSFLQMKSIIQNCGEIKDGEIFNGLHLHYGPLSQVLENVSEKSRKFKFNYVNLDYQGPINQEKIATLAHLFEFGMLASPSLLFITLNEAPIFKARLKRGNPTLGSKHKKGFPINDQETLTDYYMNEFSSEEGYSVQKIGTKKYKSRQMPMILIGYKIAKKQ